MRTHGANLGEDRMRWQRFEAVILFLDPDQAPRGIEALAAAGCEFTVDATMVDEVSAAVFGLVTGTTELDEDELDNWLRDIIRGHDGDICELGIVSETEKRLRRRRCGHCGEKWADPPSELCPRCGALIAQL